MPHKIKEEIKNLKDEIYNYKEQDDNQDLVKLIQLKNVSDDLKETLILLHSNYTTELRETRNHYCRLFNKMIDKNIETLELILKILNNENISLSLDNDNNCKIKTDNKTDNIGGVFRYITQLPKMWIWMVAVIASLTVLHSIAPNSFDNAVGLFKSVFSFGLIGNHDVRLHPDQYYHPMDKRSMRNVAPYDNEKEVTHEITD